MRNGFKTKKPFLLWFAISLCMFLLFQSISYAGTKVGNGDDGGDLEGSVPLEGGKIVKARDRAVEHLKKLNTPGIPGLGNLLPEVTKTSLYMAKIDVGANQVTDQGTFHSNLKGQVYARTFARPLESTRFFPSAMSLDEDQLIALHIHEGLHRALPASVREDEGIVTKITLSITNPEATHDGVRDTVKSLLPERDLRVGEHEEQNLSYFSGSSVGYKYQSFFRPNQPSTYEVTSMHTVHSHLYPFGSKKTRVGLGIEMSLINGPAGGTMGPLDISVQFKVINKQGFQFGLWGVASLNTLSAEELKDSPYGRDVFVLGTKIHKDLKNAYVENFISINFGGSSKQKIGAIDYTYDYGTVLDIKIRAGAKLWKVDAGGYVELHLADYYKIHGGAYEQDFGRYRILSAGPEMTLEMEDYAVTVFSRFLLNSTRGANFDFLGYIMGAGVSQGSVGASFKLYF